MQSMACTFKAANARMNNVLLMSLIYINFYVWTLRAQERECSTWNNQHKKIPLTISVKGLGLYYI